ncbi:MAG TPA: PaaI family thioesterase [Acidobacteria bacterium]|nr:PaaI family thioesterase [Acidobacteriota bacterium]
MRVRVIDKQPNSRMCFVCGRDNRFGLHSRFFRVDDDRLVALFTPADEHQSYPGRLHGGISAAILDETIGRAIMIRHGGDIWGVTLEFSMKFRKPVPLDCQLKVVASITAEGRRSFEGEGSILCPDGSVAVSGRGKYLKMPLEKITDLDLDADEWSVQSEPDDPESLLCPDLGG